MIHPGDFNGKGQHRPMALLGVNIDHVATLREARGGREPDPVWAAAAAELGGADGITVHLREDRRHIQERDLRLLRETVTVKLNLEVACEADVLRIALEVLPDQATLVPERREELTTEGGLEVAGQLEKVRQVVATLREAAITVSLFLDAEIDQIDAAARIGADAVELHTGPYALARDDERPWHLSRLATAAERVRQHGMIVHAGHGLNYQNAPAVASIDGMGELNIGHSIVARALFVGMEQAVHQMKKLIATTR